MATKTASVDFLPADTIVFHLLSKITILTHRIEEMTRSNDKMSGSPNYDSLR